MRRKLKKVLGLLIAFAVLTNMGLPAGMFSSVASAAYNADQSSEGIISLFEKPDTDTKSMLRYWIPDAGCTYEELEKEMTDMYEGGFGGVEIAFVPHNTYFDNGTYGFGTEKWIQLMKDVLTIAKGFENEFKVDFTITPHWPASLNTIDPNDDAASKELTMAYQKITTLAAIDLPMPEITTKDEADNPFIFVNELVGATIAKVESIDADGNYVLDMDTLQSVDTTETSKTTVAGIPMIDDLDPTDEAYQYVTGLYDGKVPDTSIFFEDSAGNSTVTNEREALADTQKYYSVDLSNLGIDFPETSSGAIEVNDYVLYGFYMQGTGQTPMKNNGFIAFQDSMPYVTYSFDMFSTEGSSGLTDYWNDVLLKDTELKNMLMESDANIFEDSLETDTDDGSIFWTKDLKSEFSDAEGMNYDITKYLPFVMDGSVFTNDSQDDAYKEDYDAMIDKLYLEKHVEPITKYFNDTINCGYRAQAYHTSGITLDTSGVSSQLDIAETESLAWSNNFDRFRAVAGGVHMAGKKYVSDEALANMMDTYKLTWPSAVATINSNFAAGVNRLIIHGSSYASSNTFAENTSFNAWPGWHTFGSVFADPWGSRMAYWDDVTTMTDYISRTQSVLQNGQIDMDLLVYDLNTFKETAEGTIDKSEFQTLLNAGYSYDVASSKVLMLDDAQVTNGVLAKEGPSYNALIVNNMEKITLESANRLLEYAKDGLKIIFYEQKPSKALGNTETDLEIQKTIETVFDTGNAILAANQEDILEILADEEILPLAKYNQENLRTLCRIDSDGTRYYFVYNNSEEAVESEINLSGEGNVYELNAWSGNVNAVNALGVDDHGTSIKVSLDAKEAKLFAVSADYENFPETSVNENLAGSEQTTPLASWNLTLESWGPDEVSEDKTVSTKTDISLENIELGVWGDLSVSDEQLSKLGVEDLSQVSGIGYYSTVVDIESKDKAYLLLEHNDDMITKIVVNGKDIGNINQLTKHIDISDYVIEGKNTIEVKLVTTMNNRVSTENANYKSAIQTYGLTDAKLITTQTSSTNVAVSSITVAGSNGANTITTKGGTLQMAATVLPNDATNNAVTWSVTNGTGKATINSTGLLTAVSNGTVTVTATANDGSGVKGDIVITISKQSSSSSSHHSSSGSSSSDDDEDTTTPTEPAEPTTPADTDTDTTTPTQKTFSDMSKHQWAKEAVEALASEGIISGTSATTFEPGKNISRADFLTILIKALNLKADFTDNFADVSSSAYYYQAVGIAKELGITNGEGNNKFNPKAEISRQDMMVLVVKALKIAGVDIETGTASDMSGFVDASKVSSYAADAIATLIKEGIISGSNNAINPKSQLTRAEAAVVIYKIYKK